MSDLVRLGIRVHGGQAEEALAALLELLPGGMEERRLGDDVEYATYAAPGALPDATEVRARLGPALVGLSCEPVPEDWARRWHAYLGPVSVDEAGRRLVVRPPWVPGETDDLVIDPDVLFGAGTHPTTRLVLRLLLAEPEPGSAQPLCDWGAGTGVLAVAAARLGWHPVTAVELDGAAVGVARAAGREPAGADDAGKLDANARANGVGVVVRCLDLRAADPPWAPTVCANLFAPLLRRLAGEVARPPERLLLSGVLASEADEVAAAWAARGLREARRLEEDGWAASLLVAA